MGTGFLKIQLYVGDFALHGDSVTVLVKNDGAVLHTLQSDENGTTPTVPIDAPSLEDADSITDGVYFSAVDIVVPPAQGYSGTMIQGVQIFDGITSVLDVHLEPLSPDNTTDENVIFIPPERGVNVARDNGALNNFELGQGPEPGAINPLMEPEAYANRALETFDDDPAALLSPLSVPLANEVVIPDFITVHLGTPNAAARNVRVPFKEYIKNVVSSEIYPFWERAAIEANTYAIISFALNRLFTNAHRKGNQDKRWKYGVSWQYDLT